MSAAKRAAAQKMVDGYVAKFPTVEVATAATLAQLQARGEAVVVDVREPAERAVSVIPGSYSQQEFEALSPADVAGKVVVPYCTVGYRSGKYATELQNLRSGKGGNAASTSAGALAALVKDCRAIMNGEGIVLWTHQPDAVLEDPVTKKPTRSLHVYGRTWDMAADGFDTVSFSSTAWDKVRNNLGSLFVVSFPIVVVAAVVVSVFQLKKDD